MIKFFRHIRQRLLSESKFSKYLIYAIGEIVLVVIGILIALQINNWNQDRQTDELKQTLFTDLYQELSTNIERIKQSNDNHRAYIGYLEKVLDQWQDLEYEQVKASITNNYAKKRLSLLFYLTSYSQFHDPVHSMHTKALHDGTISLIDKNFIRELSNFYHSGNHRVNQFIEDEYKLSLAINDHISEQYADIFQSASRSEDNDWDDSTYKYLFHEFRKDGRLRYLLDAKLKLMKTRAELLALQIEGMENLLMETEKDLKP